MEGVEGSIGGGHYRTQTSYGFVGGWELTVMDLKILTRRGGGYSGSNTFGD
jgi:hypothetical protein